MVSLRWDLSPSYLAAFSVEVLELIDTHSTTAVSHQDTVCLCREEQVLHVHLGARRLYYDWLLTEGNTEDPSIQLRLGKPGQTIHQITSHMFKLRSQISSCLSLTAPNTAACLRDHWTSCTAPWTQVKVSRGRRWYCFQSWIVQSEEQLRNTSGLNGDQATAFTAH